MTSALTLLVFGATGRTGRRFVPQALGEGHRVRALVRTPARLTVESDGLDVRTGSITDPPDLDTLVAGVDAVILMLGDREAQRHASPNADFVRKLVPAMRRQGVRRLLYQAGALSRPPGGRLGAALWVIRHTFARAFLGQHRDNEKVMAYLAYEAPDIEWIVHRAAIALNGPSKGVLHRSDAKSSISAFVDCAAYSLRTVEDDSAIHTTSLSSYVEEFGKRGSRRPQD